ncbi:MAG: S-layer homology domain-containing protein [Oscillospiraceae bacterium]|jgi:hypothetical protein
MKKRVLALILTLALALSISLPALAASFTDLEGHWAKEYMEDLASRGFLSGYGDGTIRPESNITACEALVLLSRFYSLEQATAELIYADFGPYVEEKVSPSLSWAYDELAVCLAAGIISKTELESLKLTSEIEKELLALYLVRAMQLQLMAEEMADAPLSFADASDITPEYRGAVAVLAAAGVVTGDTGNRFLPNFKLTRAVVATMISRSLDYLNSINKTLSIEGYDNITRTAGIITSVSGSKFVLTGFDGLGREYTVGKKARITVNGEEKSLTSDYVGCYAKAGDDKGALSFLAIESAQNVKWVQGKAGSIITSTPNALYVTDLRTGSSASYTVSSSAVITQDGAQIPLSSLAKNNFVTLKIKDNAATEIHSYPGSLELTGSVEELAFGTTTTLKVEDANGTVYCFSMPITRLPQIYRGESLISIDRLKVGDEVTVATKDCAISSITIRGAQNVVKGVVNSIIHSTAGIMWVIATEGGTSQTFSVDETPGVYSENRSILLSDIKPGDTVSVVVYGSTITEIHLISSAVSTTKLEGTVLLVESSARKITALSASGKLIYIDTSSVGSIISAGTGKSMGLGSIPAEAKFVAYGSYKDSNTFKAASIVIET